MDVQNAILNGLVFKNGPGLPQKKKKKKKLSGAQQMRLDYHARIAAKAAAREKRKAEKAKEK